MAHPNPATARHNEQNAAAALARETRIVSMRAARMTNAQIAAEEGCAESTVSAIYHRARRRMLDANAATVEEQVFDSLAALDAVARQAHAVSGMTKSEATRLKALNVVLQAEDRRAKLLGLYAPEQHRHLHGHVDPGIDIPFEQLDAMSDDELAAALDAQRTLRAVETRTEDDAEADAEPDEDDGLPAEVVIDDPGPRALAPAPPEAEPDGFE